jgi:hypothetical protein
MRWGQAWGCFYGDPENFIIILNIVNTKDGVAVTFVLIEGYSQFVQLVVDGKNSGNPIYVKSGVMTTLRGGYNHTTSPHLVSVEPMGPFSRANAFDVTQGQILFAQNRSARLHLEIQAVPEQFSIDGAA